MPTSAHPDIHSKSNLAALAIVVIINWLIAHLATNWVMPQEVQSSAQTLITLGLALWITGRRNRQATSPVTP